MRNPFETDPIPDRDTDLPLCEVYPAVSVLFPPGNQPDDVSMCYGGFVTNVSAKFYYHVASALN